MSAAGDHSRHEPARRLAGFLGAGPLRAGFVRRQPFFIGLICASLWSATHFAHSDSARAPTLRATAGRRGATSPETLSAAWSATTGPCHVDGNQEQLVFDPSFADAPRAESAFLRTPCPGRLTTRTCLTKGSPDSHSRVLRRKRHVATTRRLQTPTGSPPRQLQERGREFRWNVLVCPPHPAHRFAIAISQ